MRILIYREVALPPAYLPRVRYFCSFFLERGWEVDLVTENLDEPNYVQEGISFLAIDYYKNKKGIKFKIEWIAKFILGLLFDYKGRYFYKRSKPFLQDKQYDLVFTSSCFTFPLTTAARVAKEKDIPLFVDLRDIVEQSPDDNYFLGRRPPKVFGNFIFNIYKKISVKRRNKALKVANAVTTVSPWHVETLSAYNPNAHLIYNGYDETKFIPETVKTDRFVISYFGRVYNEKMRNPRFFFQALQNLEQKKVFSVENTIVKWYLDDISENVIRGIAEEYGLSDLMEYHQFIQPDELPAGLNSSSVLLVLCNDAASKKFFGMMTTKFFEAIGTDRPILCTPNNHDTLAQVIEETRCGLVSSDVEEIEGFLQEKFLEWKQTGKTKGTVEESVRMSFSRKKGAETLEKIFQDNLKNKER